MGYFCCVKKLHTSYRKLVLVKSTRTFFNSTSNTTNVKERRVLQLEQKRIYLLSSPLLKPQLFNHLNILLNYYKTARGWRGVAKALL